jgi:hypothetical protein
MSEFNSLVFRKFRYVAIAALCVLDSCKSPPKVENPLRIVGQRHHMFHFCKTGWGQAWREKVMATIYPREFVAGS